MELKNFVKQVLIDITEAVVEAKRESNGAIASFRLLDGHRVVQTNDTPSLVEFDIGVSVKNSTMFVVGAEAGINILPVKGGASGKNEKGEDHHQEHRIKFSVPVYFQALSTKPNEHDVFHDPLAHTQSLNKS
ncbi:hypothetical protein [Asticcacaulis sp.]|uniref:hypothetical protein n=1 Tax=Asticcacaulis sp. TaxID=1872648 RepID=UPI003F7C00F0